MSDHQQNQDRKGAASLAGIRRAAAWVELRMRLARALRVLPPALMTTLAVAAVTLAVRKVVPSALSNRHAWEILGAAGALVLVTLIVAMARRLPPQAGTVALDRHHRLDGRLTNALAFVREEARTALMELTIDDACEHAGTLKPREAAPLRFPRDLLGVVVLGAGVAALALLRLPPPPIPLAPQAKQIDAIQMSPDDVELFRDAARELTRKDQSPEVKAAIEKFNQLVEDIANKRLDRLEAFRRMEEIEREMLSSAAADAKAFDEALKQTAEELKKSDLSKPFADSLEKRDLEKAKKDLRDLSKQLKSGKKPDKAALDKLKKALERASAKKKEALEAINEKRNELREHLLKKVRDKNEPDAGAPKPEEERLLKKKQRELERLDREAERQQQAQRKLDRLDRDLAKAAEDLLKDLGLSADDLEQAAEDINRMQEEEMSDKEKEELRQRLQELRELLRQQGQGSKQRMARMLKFGKRARGGQSGQRGQQGEKGDEQGDEGRDGEGKDGQGKDGQGMGPGGKVLTLQRGSGPGSLPGGGGPGQPGGTGQSGTGKEAGVGHDPNLAGKRTDLKGETHDVEAQGIDTKQGPSNSEVILTAAERGFKGSGYKKVFTDYRTQAEKEINKDTVPDGYRFYVHRYFQLIRPRE